MIVRYLYSEGCEMCQDFKEAGIYRALGEILDPVYGVSWDPAPVGMLETEGFELNEDGRVVPNESIVLNTQFPRFKRDRNPDDNPRTPVMQLVKKPSDETKEFYPQFAISDKPYKIGYMLEHKPFQCKRLVVQSLFHEYLSFGLDLYPKDEVRIRKTLKPEMQNNEFQLTEWRDVFRQASEL